MMAEDLLLVGRKADSSEGAWTPRRTPTVKEPAVRIVDRTDVELMTIAVALVEELFWRDERSDGESRMIKTWDRTSSLCKHEI